MRNDCYRIHNLVQLWLHDNSFLFFKKMTKHFALSVSTFFEKIKNKLPRKKSWTTLCVRLCNNHFSIKNEKKKRKVVKKVIGVI
jgi:predicted DNA-binding transcriptional regulator AlpA